MSGTPIGASAHLIGASALLLVLRHSCWCYGTPAAWLATFDWCSGTPTGAMALLLREKARPDWCSGTPAGAMALLFCIVPSGTYYTASYSFLIIGLGSQIDI